MLRRLLLAGLAAVVLASCSSGGDDGSSSTTTPFIFDGSTTTLVPTTPIVGRVLSPEGASVQGAGGRGMVVILKFTAKDPTVLPAEFRLGGALPAPAPAAKPGHNPAFPGLVVGLSSTGSALGGPSVNLANLFQVISPSLQLDGSREVTAVWTNSAVDFGTDVVAGTAPDTIPPSQANSEVLSNTVEVTFHIGAAESGLTVGTGTPTSTTPPAAGATTTTRAGATTTTTRAGATTTTVRATTTTRAPTTTIPASTTTSCPNLLGLGC
jgi:hypothetical protein